MNETTTDDQKQRTLQAVNGVLDDHEYHDLPSEFYELIRQWSRKARFGYFNGQKVSNEIEIRIYLQKGIWFYVLWVDGEAVRSGILSTDYQEYNTRDGHKFDDLVAELLAVERVAQA